MRYLRLLLIVIIVSVATYFISLNLFLGLKIKGYSYLFYADRPYDLVIKHGYILDGTGENEAFRGDLAIRGGYIVGVGYVNPADSPVFDASGLTLLPVPLPLERNEETVEHTLAGSYPRYLPQYIYLQEGRYQGLNLMQAAAALGLTVEDAFRALKADPAVNPKALIAEIPCQVEQNSIQEYLARLTGYRATYYGLQGKGVIKDGAAADLYLLKRSEFKDEQLAELLKQCQVPQGIYQIMNGVFLNQ